MPITRVGDDTSKIPGGGGVVLKLMVWRFNGLAGSETGLISTPRTIGDEASEGVEARLACAVVLARGVNRGGASGGGGGDAVGRCASSCNLLLCFAGELDRDLERGDFDCDLGLLDRPGGPVGGGGGARCWLILLCGGGPRGGLGVWRLPFSVLFPALTRFFRCGDNDFVRREVGGADGGGGGARCDIVLHFTATHFLMTHRFSFVRPGGVNSIAVIYHYPFIFATFVAKSVSHAVSQWTVKQWPTSINN